MALFENDPIPEHFPDDVVGMGPINMDEFDPERALKDIALDHLHALADDADFEAVVAAIHAARMAVFNQHTARQIYERGETCDEDLLSDEDVARLLDEKRKEELRNYFKTPCGSRAAAPPRRGVPLHRRIAADTPASRALRRDGSLALTVHIEC